MLFVYIIVALILVAVAFPYVLARYHDPSKHDEDFEPKAK